MIPVASRASTIEYAIRDVVVPATKLEAEGHQIIKLNIGDPIAKLIISVPGMAPKKMQLVATEAVSQGGFVSRLRTAALVLLRKVKKGRSGG